MGSLSDWLLFCLVPFTSKGSRAASVQLSRVLWAPLSSVLCTGIVTGSFSPACLTCFSDFRREKRKTTLALPELNCVLSPWKCGWCLSSTLGTCGLKQPSFSETGWMTCLNAFSLSQASHSAATVALIRGSPCKGREAFFWSEGRNTGRTGRFRCLLFYSWGQTVSGDIHFSEILCWVNEELGELIYLVVNSLEFQNESVCRLSCMGMGYFPDLMKALLLNFLMRLLSLILKISITFN